MSWVEESRRAWDEHRRVEQEYAEAEAARTVAYVERLRDTLHARPQAGTDRLGEQEHAIVEGDTVRLALSIGRTARNDGAEFPAGVRAVELRAGVTNTGLPEVHAWLLTGRRSPPGSVVPLDDDWVDRGPVETLADLGRALDPREAPPATETPAADLPVGDLLLRVMQALVRDVVSEEMEGRYGGGST